VTTDLSGFALINPCGITDRPVTSLAKEMPHPEQLPGLEEMAHRAARQFGAVFQENVQLVESVQALLGAARADDEGAVGFPANDAPLEIPPEIERLQHKAERPVRA
jgi:lipoyl(octanoyl) transferase